jgi:RimJ/RimL family protein N-acetyltransferase
VPQASVELYLATAADWRVVREVRLRALRDAPYAFASTHDRESAFAEEDWLGRLTSGSATFIARTDAGPVGICGGLPPRDGTTELVAMWVDPAARGSGVAAKLAAAVTEWAAEQAAERIHLWVTGTNQRARRLYERLGFALTGEQQPLPSDPAVQEFGMARAV